ncbi:MAG: DUF1853 family protein, partial [Flavobacteriales bacterium]|nr:DUF1853 family protein [Flavobacteriales bacterium]
GPNATDNLNRKLTKLKNHQLRLSEHPEIQSITNNEAIESKLFMKGQLFYHLNNIAILPADVNPLHETGWWCFSSEVKSMLSDNLKWKTIEKPNWIGTTQTTEDSELFSQQQMHEHLTYHFENETSSILLVGLNETHNGWVETTRGFVVNNLWPEFKS